MFRNLIKRNYSVTRKLLNTNNTVASTEDNLIINFNTPYNSVLTKVIKNKNINKFLSIIFFKYNF